MVRSLEVRACLQLLFDALCIESEPLADPHRPDLRPYVGLVVELALHLCVLRLAVLAVENERREEDRLKADHEREQAEREGVKDEASAQNATVDENPTSEPGDVQVHECQ